MNQDERARSLTDCHLRALLYERALDDEGRADARMMLEQAAHLGKLTALEANLLIMHYSLGETLAACGRAYGITGARCLRIENKALRKLRRVFYSWAVSL